MQFWGKFHNMLVAFPPDPLLQWAGIKSDTPTGIIYITPNESNKEDVWGFVSSVKWAQFGMNITIKVT